MAESTLPVDVIENINALARDGFTLGLSKQMLALLSLNEGIGMNE